VNKSPELNELFNAHSAFLADIRNVHRGSKGYGYNYSSLPEVLDVVQPLLAKHKLSVTQWPEISHDAVSLTTILGHASGQWLSGTIVMGVERGKGMSLAQSVGSVVSYARRYSLMAALNISSDDNDAAVTEPQKIPALAHSNQFLTELEQLMEGSNDTKNYVLSVLDKKRMGLQDLSLEQAGALIKAIKERHANG
jgi:hypothetical protein